METSSLPSHRRRWLFPRPLTVQLGLALTRLAIAGMIAIAVSGLLAGLFGVAYGRTFVSGDPPGTSYSAARCADYFEYSPGASTCEEAATWHHFGEVVQYRLAVGVLGLLLLGVYAFARRRLGGRSDALLPPGFEATAGVAMYGAAAAYLLGISANSGIVHQTAGVGQWLSGGIVAAVMALAYGLMVYRILLRLPGSADR